MAKPTGQDGLATQCMTEFNGLSCDLTAAIRLPQVRHSFTHYHLDIFPLLIEAEPTTNEVAGAADSERWLWYPLNHSLEVGLAAPVKKLLSGLGEDPHPVSC